MCNTQPGHRSAFPTLGQSSARALLTAAIASVSGKEKHPQRLLAHASDAAYVEPQPCATLSQGIGQPFQRSARAALGVSLSNTRPKQRSGLAHPALASVSGPAAETKKKPSVRGLTNRSNSVQVTPTLRTSHHARSTTRSS